MELNILSDSKINANCSVSGFVTIRRSMLQDSNLVNSYSSTKIFAHGPLKEMQMYLTFLSPLV